MTLDLAPDPPAALMLIMSCGYSAQCRARDCQQRAPILVRKMDQQGRFLRQIEMCDTHADDVVQRERERGLAVEDRR